MASNIDGTTITLTRGDTFRTYVAIFDAAGTPYTPLPGDTVRFALKKKYGDVKPLIKKEIPTDTLLLQLDPKDTKRLPFDDYVYDIQLTFANGDIDTFIDRAKFVLTEEVD